MVLIYKLRGALIKITIFAPKSRTHQSCINLLIARSAYSNPNCRPVCNNAPISTTALFQLYNTLPRRGASWYWVVVGGGGGPLLRMLCVNFQFFRKKKRLAQ
jgi:hypothetical protein